MVAWCSGLLGEQVPHALALSPGLEAIRVSTLPGCRLAVTGSGEAPLVQERTLRQRGGGRQSPRAGGHQGVHTPRLQAGSGWQGRRHCWCRREPSAGRRGQALPQQQVHWGGLRGHQQTAVPPDAVSTQAPSSGPAQDCLDGLCPPNTKSGPEPLPQAPTPNPLYSAQVTRNGQ